MTVRPVINLSSLLLMLFPRRECPRWVLIVTTVFMLASAAPAQTAPLTPDIPTKFAASTASYDYVKRVEMIPMRDGVKLYTVIVIPRGAGVNSAPMILTRTPYNATKRAQRNKHDHHNANQ